MPEKKPGRGIPTILIILVLILSVAYMAREMGRNEIAYSELIQKFRDQKVTEFSLNLGTGKLVYKEEGKKDEQSYLLPSVELFLFDTKDAIEAYNGSHSTPLKYDMVPGSNWGTILINVLPLVAMGAMFVVFFFSMNQQGGGRLSSITRARVQQEDEGRKATFADVAGCDEEKEELLEIIDYLKDPRKYNALGAKIPHGVLLVGPPGTGKTLLARAVAGEAGAPFFSISGSDFVELYVGVGAGRVRDLFDKAKRNRPSIIFIDEIDAVGRQRGAGLGGGHDEREQTLNQLLVEMDGFGANEGVIVMAATNRADILDTALLRPGRFDRTVYVGLPDVKGREDILKVHARRKPLGPDIDLKAIAKTTVGFTGADLENLLNESALLAARRSKPYITMSEVEEAMIKVIAGPEKKSRVVSEKERRLTAFHEAGHAVVSAALEHVDPVHQISIIPRGMAGGMTIYLPTEDKSFNSRSEMLDDIVSLLGGRVAEKLVLNDISTGASNDLDRATGIAKSMVMRYGMSDSLGPVVYDSGSGEVFLGRDYGHTKSYSEKFAAEIDEEIKRIMEEAYERCARLLKENMDILRLTAGYLLEHEVMDSETFNYVCKNRTLPPEKPAEPEAEPMTVPEGETEWVEPEGDPDWAKPPKEDQGTGQPG